ncbi:hypothetical protein SAMN04324258_2313 [Krasilnikoviella flava]|uniref:Uncharacterized protein n=1 Tax=Krasilnikoviella flava TaxID=526729 RepID=A0A1T5KRD5_9MICO|nr:hypothetical protein SAMN04324258_2313 [Krasilnikoviella flava]
MSALRSDLGARAEITGPTVDGDVEGFSVRSETDGSVEVWLMHDADGVIVGLDRCPGWQLPRTPSSVNVFLTIIDAAVAGRVEVGTGRKVRSYRVVMPDGTVMEDSARGAFASLLEMPWKPRTRWATATAYAG